MSAKPQEEVMKKKIVKGNNKNKPQLRPCIPFLNH